MSIAHDVIVVGGGPAGCAAAITLARSGRSVLLLEAGRYPRQKVCGEFLSSETLPVLSALLGGNDEIIAAAPEIDWVRFLSDGRTAEAPVTPSARSIARSILDPALWQAAGRAGADARENSPVTSIARDADGFAVRCASTEFRAPSVIDASGRWSRLRRHASTSGAKVGLKAHFAGEPTPGAVELFFFPGGYCGVQEVAPRELNACAMVDARCARTLDEVFALHPELRARSRDWRRIGDELATAPVVMRQPQPVRDGILRVGDAAGFLEPLFGDGMSVAMRSGVLAAECVLSERDYAGAYLERFRRAFLGASIARRVFAIPRPFRSWLWPVLERSPRLLSGFSRRAR